MGTAAISTPLPNLGARSLDRTRAAQASTSDAIEVARVLLVIGLVFLHYFNYPNLQTNGFDGVNLQHHVVATFVNSFIVFFFFSAVPLLSTISGWLFFRMKSHPWSTIRRRMHGRVWSLFVPLLTWNSAYLLAALAIYASGYGRGLISQLHVDFAHGGVMTYVNAITGLQPFPIGFQFWFVRDLFVSVLVSPIMWVTLQRAPIAGAIILGAVWIDGGTLGGIFIRTDVPFFFYLGGLIQCRKLDVSVSWETTRIVLTLYAVLVAVRALAPLYTDALSTDPNFPLEVATRLCRPVGVVACWGVALRLASSQFGTWLARYGGFAFFLHAGHYPIILLIKHVLWRISPGDSDAWMIVHYVLSVGATVAVVAASAAIIYRFSPAAYGFLAGGRHFVTSGKARVEPSALPVGL